jgi:hypothetical protein
MVNEMIEPGDVVMVTVGGISAEINHHLRVVCLAVVRERASDAHWWLEVAVGPGTVLPQMYRDDEILGVPGRGITMPSGPEWARR